MPVLSPLGSEATFERIKRLYEEGKLDATGVRNAVTKGLITQEQADEILGEIKSPVEPSAE